MPSSMQVGAQPPRTPRTEKEIVNSPPLALNKNKIQLPIWTAINRQPTLSLHPHRSVPDPRVIDQDLVNLLTR